MHALAHLRALALCQNASSYIGHGMGQIRAGRFDGKLAPLAVRRLSEPGLHADGNGLYLRISEGGGRASLLR
jgi:hypothetical protein